MRIYFYWGTDYLQTVGMDRLMEGPANRIDGQMSPIDLSMSVSISALSILHIQIVLNHMPTRSAFSQFAYKKQPWRFCRSMSLITRKLYTRKLNTRKLNTRKLNTENSTHFRQIWMVAGHFFRVFLTSPILLLVWRSVQIIDVIMPDSNWSVALGFRKFN